MTLTEHEITLQRSLTAWAVDCQHCMSVYIVLLRNDMDKPKFCARCGERPVIYNAEGR